MSPGFEELILNCIHHRLLNTFQFCMHRGRYVKLTATPYFWKQFSSQSYRPFSAGYLHLCKPCHSQLCFRGLFASRQMLLHSQLLPHGCDAQGRLGSLQNTIGRRRINRHPIAVLQICLLWLYLRIETVSYLFFMVDSWCMNMVWNLKKMGHLFYVLMPFMQKSPQKGYD